MQLDIKHASKISQPVSLGISLWDHLSTLSLLIMFLIICLVFFADVACKYAINENVSPLNITHITLWFP